jgi:hypothetical protein
MTPVTRSVIKTLRLLLERPNEADFYAMLAVEDRVASENYGRITVGNIADLTLEFTGNDGVARPGRVLARQKEQKLFFDQAEVVGIVRDGIEDVIGPAAFAFITEEELLARILPPTEPVTGAEVLAGMAPLEYDNSNPKKQEIRQWMSEIVPSLTVEEATQLSRFITAFNRRPVVPGTWISVNPNANLKDHDMPRAHTCFGAYFVPLNSSREKMRQRILVIM